MHNMTLGLAVRYIIIRCDAARSIAPRENSSQVWQAAFIRAQRPGTVPMVSTSGDSSSEEMELVLLLSLANRKMF